MGQKTHPIGCRLGYTKTWDSRWFAEKEYSLFLHEDIYIRQYLRKKLASAGISRVVVERFGSKAQERDLPLHHRGPEA